MDPKISYYTTTEIHLSMEDYTNKGLTPEDIMENIKGIQGVDYSKHSGINSNITISTSYNDPHIIHEIVREIKLTLDLMLHKIK